MVSKKALTGKGTKIMIACYIPSLVSDECPNAFVESRVVSGCIVPCSQNGSKSSADWYGIEDETSE